MSRYKKIGRNDPCWCGSGKKLKYCCKTRENSEPISRNEIMDELKRSYQSKYCLHPDASEKTCKGNIIKAHTIQRSTMRDNVSANGHVLRFRERKPNEFDNGILPQPERIGINKASTFTGFCKKHDDELFAKIEKQPIKIIDSKKACLFGFRALCKEYYLKKSAIDFAQSLINNSQNPITKMQKEYFKTYLKGLNHAIKDLNRVKESYDNALRCDDYSGSIFYSLYIDKCPDLLCSGAAQPEYDFNGKRLQDLSDMNVDFDFLTCCIIALESGGLILFNWMGNQPTCKHLIGSLDRFNDSDIVESVLIYCIETFENIVFSQSCWEHLNKSKKNELTNRFYTVLVNRIRDPNYLRLKGEKAVNWQVTKRDTNLDM